jgi:hypothetical protein
MTYLLYAPFVGGGLVAGWVIYSGITKGLAFMARAFGTRLSPLRGRAPSGLAGSRFNPSRDLEN